MEGRLKPGIREPDGGAALAAAGVGVDAAVGAVPPGTGASAPAVSTGVGVGALALLKAAESLAKTPFCEIK
jgi:hypothetical protein